LDAISISKLTKTYAGGKTALNGLSLTVRAGEIFSLLGPNGAGKSTLINMLTTYLKPTCGEVLIMGKELCKEQEFVRTQIACAAQKVSINDHLSLYENMKFQSRLHKIDSSDAKRRMDTLIDVFGLKEYVQNKVAAYSGGIKRRLDIAMSMMSYPKILFLDEPTVGLDIESRQAMWNIVKKIQIDFGTTVFLTTHYLEEADLLSDTVCIIKDGHEIVRDTPQALRQYTSQDLIKINLCDCECVPRVVELLEGLPMVRGVRNEEEKVYVNVQDCQQNFLGVNKFMMNSNIKFDSIEVVKPSLDDIFITLTQNSERSV
jgi:ABC-2 type transport system ATP-binding protein